MMRRLPLLFVCLLAACALAPDSAPLQDTAGFDFGLAREPGGEHIDFSRIQMRFHPAAGVHLASSYACCDTDDHRLECC